MPLELQVIHVNDFIRLDPHEHLDFEASKKALEALARACRKRGLNNALLDLRSLPVPTKPRFSPTDISSLVSSFRDAGFSRDQRLAVLYRHDVYGGVKTFAFISRMRGLQVQAFAEFEGAVQWLMEGQHDAECRETGDTVPITAPMAKVQKLPMPATNEGACASTARHFRKPTRA